MKIKSQWVACALTLAFVCAPLALASTGTSSQGPASSPQAQPNRMKAMHPVSTYRDWTTAQVKSLQEALTAKGFPVKADGQWGKATRNAIMGFQKKSGLKPTGYPNQATMEKLGLAPSK